MSQLVEIKNWSIGATPDILQSIHQSEVNISIQTRDISELSDEISTLLNQGVEFKASGSVDAIISELKNTIDVTCYHELIDDIEHLLNCFKKVSNVESFRCMLAVITSDMCRKFHTDINDLRMLCTYSGPGTLWLSEDNVNRNALNTFEDDKKVIIDTTQIKQAKTGDVVVLKGAAYPEKNTRAAVHRSPAIEESGIKRLVFRIDTNEFLNFE